ncbi:parallel beta-helix domain-containing protein [Paucibacter sp. R3-3]|uniref:Parallel beta-helix domain-containing protein n=1 Tax=Roseateles agri TaxID=3098619 RepID=A0ABU5DQJ4_9BURK|nr:parallel beta-helix domain-containing protein [Paucibacter sp. R3-3]MDY0747993.1 parallel beta-helix domain-containing protein [Paucibacter sp. R3-3]
MGTKTLAALPCWAVAAALAAALVGCSKQDAAPVGGPSGALAGDLKVDTELQKKIQEQLLDAKPGTVVEIPAGSYHFDRGLSLRANGVTIRGAGKDKTILSFKDQTSGPEGLIVYASDFTLEGLTIEDSKGDGVKINDGENITVRGVRVRWTGGPKTSNGPYGIYPVKTKNVLIEDSEAWGAADAGIYVGQSRDVIVRRCHAEQNVAGIEIENTINADVYDNVATGNTGGILVFNMPNLTQHGYGTRVYKNKAVKNNLGNFGAKGTAVASVPAGSGIVVNSNSKVEIFDNDIADNATANVIVSSYYSTGYFTAGGTEPDYDPYPRAIYVLDNRFSGGGDSPDGLDLKTLKTVMFGINGRFPDVVWDGYRDEKRANVAEERICVKNGKSEVLNADGPNKYKDPKVDTKSHDCELPRLPAVELKGRSA